MARERDSQRESYKNQVIPGYLQIFPRLCPLRSNINGYTLQGLREVDFSKIIQKVTKKVNKEIITIP